MTTNPAPSPEIVKVRRAIIRPGRNDRTIFKPNELDELATSINDHGLIQPITIRPIEDPVFEYEIVAGERRFRATGLLGWEAVPCIIRVLTDKEASDIMLHENIHRADIDPLDEAQAYKKRQTEFGYSTSELAKAAKVSEKRVKARLLLLELVPEAQQLIRTGQMGTQFGECMAPLDTNRQRIALQYMVKNDKPLLREFQAIVGKLLEEQAQDSMFDLSLIAEQALGEHRAEQEEWRYHRQFPVDETIPVMKRVGTIGLSFETYLSELANSPDIRLRAAAPIVGRVYQSMLQQGMCYPPRKERLSPLEKPNGKPH